jgi:opacity protein-like surface antigen
MRMRKLLPFVGAAAIAAAPLTSARAELAGPYFGGSYGLYQFDESGIDEEDTMWKAFIGAQFNDWLGFEGAFVNLDPAREQGAGFFEADGWTAAAIASFPIGRQSAFFLKGGAFWWDAQIGGQTINANNVQDDDFDPFYGAGFRIGLSDNFSLRLEYERYEVLNADINSASIGLQANF